MLLALGYLLEVPTLPLVTQSSVAMQKGHDLSSFGSPELQIQQSH